MACASVTPCACTPCVVDGNLYTHPSARLVARLLDAVQCKPASGCARRNTGFATVIWCTRTCAGVVCMAKMPLLEAICVKHDVADDSSTGKPSGSNQPTDTGPGSRSTTATSGPGTQQAAEPPLHPHSDYLNFSESHGHQAQLCYVCSRVLHSIMCGAGMLAVTVMGAQQTDCLSSWRWYLAGEGSVLAFTKLHNWHIKVSKNPWPSLRSLWLCHFAGCLVHLACLKHGLYALSAMSLSPS